MAKELAVVIVGSLFERRAPGVHHNTAVVLDSDGFHDPGAVGRFVPRAGFREHQSAAPSTLAAIPATQAAR